MLWITPGEPAMNSPLLPEEDSMKITDTHDSAAEHFDYLAEETVDSDVDLITLTTGSPRRSVSEELQDRRSA